MRLELIGLVVFRPLDIFRTLYKKVCHQVSRTGVLVYETSPQLVLPSGFVRLLEQEFVRQADVFAALPDASSTEWHRAKLAESKADWLTTRSVKTCFVCFQGRPVDGLGCRGRHIVCRKCFKRLGVQSDAWTVTVNRCFLCQSETPGISLRDKPPTATVNLLSIDGGGARGIIPLVFLQVLEEKIGLPYPVQENFHYIIGTSSGLSIPPTKERALTYLAIGGITALALSANGWSVDDCIYHFERMAQLAFQQHSHRYLGWIWQLYILLRSLITNGIYPTQRLEALLREVYGSDRRILDCSSASAMGINVGITVTSMKPEPFLFTNYNGVGDRGDKKRYDYGVLLGDALVWEM